MLSTIKPTQPDTRLTLALILLLGLGMYGNVPAQSPQSPRPPKPKNQPIVELKPGYSLPDTARSPFYEKKDIETSSINPEAFVKKLAASLTITGLTGTPDHPENARLLISSKIYKVNDSIPVMFNNTLYNLVLVRVKFPGKVILKYKDTTTVVDTTKPTKGVSP